MGVPANVVLAGISGGFEGIAKGLSWREENKIKREQIVSREDIARENAELRAWIAKKLEEGKDRRWEEPSGNVTATQTGATERAGMTVAGANERAATAEAGRNARWKIPSGVALLGSETTRRGQDMGATTTRRGQDISSTTARRGQDLSYSLGTAGQGVTMRGQDIGSETTRRGQDQATVRAKMRPRGFSFDSQVADPSAVMPPAPGDAAPPLSDVAAPIAPGRGVAPVAPTPRAPSGGVDQTRVSQLSNQLTAAIARKASAKTDGERQAADREIARIRDEALRMKQGGR